MVSLRKKLQIQLVLNDCYLNLANSSKVGQHMNTFLRAQNKVLVKTEEPWSLIFIPEEKKIYKCLGAQIREMFGEMAKRWERAGRHKIIIPSRNDRGCKRYAQGPRSCHLPLSNSDLILIILPLFLPFPCFQSQISMTFLLNVIYDLLLNICSNSIIE